MLINIFIACGQPLTSQCPPPPPPLPPSIQLSSLMSSVGEDRGRLDDIGSQMAQLRERMTELDRAVTAISNAGKYYSCSVTYTPRFSFGPLVSEARLQPEAPEEEEGAKYVGADALQSLQGMLGQLQQEQERLMGTAAHLSHELEVNREHVKVIVWLSLAEDCSY